MVGIGPPLVADRAALTRLVPPDLAVAVNDRDVLADYHREVDSLTDADRRRPYADRCCRSWLTVTSDCSCTPRSGLFTRGCSPRGQAADRLTEQLEINARASASAQAPIREVNPDLF